MIARTTAAAATLLLALSLGACSSSAGKAGSRHARRPPAAHSGTLSPVTEPQGTGRRGGVLTVYESAELGSIDPSLAQSVPAREIMNATQRPLFSYAPGTLSEPRPDLASAPASISPDGRTITVQIRRGVRFGPPVDREVTSADVAYAIERAANRHVASPIFRAYFSTLEGAGAGARGGPIRGIAVPDAHTIVFHLTSHDQTRVLVDALALPISAPVPESYARRYDAHDPSTYGGHQVATGPYMLESKHGGKVLGAGYRPGKSALLVRNPNWQADTDSRPAYLDAIRVELGGDRSATGRRVLTGSHLAQNAPSEEVVRFAHDHTPKQLQISPSAGVEYIALNNSRGPFAKPDLRKAFWAALNRTQMNRAAGRALTATVATHFLYPGVVGFGQAVRYLSAWKLSYNEHPSGDMEVARRYLRHAGYAKGRFTGRRALTVVGLEGERSAGVAISALHELGFQTRLRLVSPAAMYSTYCGVPAKEIDVCLNARSKARFADGQEVLYSAFDGNAIRAGHNENWGQVNAANLNSAIEREAKLVENSDRETGWGAVDNGLVGQAVAIPCAWLSEPAIESKNVAGVGDLWNAGAWDLSFTSLR